MAIEFAHEGLKVEFDGLHPAVKAVIQSLQSYSESVGFPNVVITHCWRTKVHQKKMYTSVADNILEKLKNDITLTDEESRMLERVESIAKSQNLSLEKAFDRWAETKFSWHMARCAADIRNRHYNKSQRQAVMAFLMGKISRGEWELLEHDIGRGDHIHIAKKDAEWKTNYAV